MTYERLEEIFTTKDEARYWQAYLFVYCVEEDIEVDTAQYDDLIRKLYKAVQKSWQDFDLELLAFDILVSKMLV